MPTWLPPAPHVDAFPDKPKPRSPDAKPAYFSGLEMRTPFREGVEGRTTLGGGAWVEYYKAQFSHSDCEGLCLELQVPQLTLFTFTGVHANMGFSTSWGLFVSHCCRCCVALLRVQGKKGLALGSLAKIATSMGVAE